MRNRDKSGCDCPSTFTCNASNGRYQSTPSGTIASSSKGCEKSAGEPFSSASRTCRADCFHFASAKSLTAISWFGPNWPISRSRA